jgi:hypothetical protein
MRRLELEASAVRSAIEILVVAPVTMKDRDGAIDRARRTLAGITRRHALALEAARRQAQLEFEEGPPPWS